MGSLKQRLEDQVCREKSSARRCAAWSHRSHPPARQNSLKALSGAAPSDRNCDRAQPSNEKPVKLQQAHRMRALALAALRSEASFIHTHDGNCDGAGKSITSRLSMISRLAMKRMVVWPAQCAQPNRQRVTVRIRRTVRRAVQCPAIPRFAHRERSRSTDRTASGDSGGEGGDGEGALPAEARLGTPTLRGALRLPIGGCPTNPAALRSTPTLAEVLAELALPQHPSGKLADSCFKRCPRHKFGVHSVTWTPRCRPGRAR